MCTNQHRPYSTAGFLYRHREQRQTATQKSRLSTNFMWFVWRGDICSRECKPRGCYSEQISTLNLLPCAVGSYPLKPPFQIIHFAFCVARLYLPNWQQTFQKMATNLAKCKNWGGKWASDSKYILAHETLSFKNNKLSRKKLPSFDNNETSLRNPTLKVYQTCARFMNNKFTRPKLFLI